MPKRKTPQQKALALLASSTEGCPEALMLAHGVTIAQMVELVRAGLATAHSERIVMGVGSTEIARLRITDAGRRVIRT